jgi:hypothetical protein
MVEEKQDSDDLSTFVIYTKGPMPRASVTRAVTDAGMQLVPMSGTGNARRAVQQ